MKILSVTLNNINALKGRWFIDFDQPPLENAGIFVICGPTGSGKTSVLDAITLALYGETDRLQKKGIENIMTRHTGDCYCEVVFQVNKEKFKSHWSIRRSRGKPDGKVQSPKRLLYDMNGNEPVVIAQKISSVQEKIEFYTGLDYKRFSRSMMLAQGRFAEFLNAPDRERASLLEKMTGTDIYSKLSIKAFEIARQEKENLNLLQKEQHSISPMPPEEIEKLNNDLISIKEQSAQKKTIIHKLQKEKEHRKHIHRLIEEKKNVEQKLATARQQELEMQTDLLRLKRSNLALEFKSELDAVNVQKQRLKELSIEIQSLNSQLEKNRKYLQEMENKQVLVQKQFDDAQKIQKETEPLIQEARIIDRDLAQLQKQINNLQKNLNQMSSRFLHLEGLKKETEDNHKKMTDQQLKIIKWLEINAHDENMSEHIPYIHKDLNEIHDTRNQYNEIQKKIKTKNQNLKKLEAQLKKQQKSRIDNQKEMETLVKTIQKTKHQLSKQLGGQNINDLENQLNESLQQSYLFDSIRKLSARYEEIQKNMNSSREQLKKNAIAKFHCKKILSTIYQKMDQEKNTLIALEKAVQHEMLVASYSENRRKLMPESPCPLCGSIHHPYVTEKKISKETQIQKEYNKKKNDVDNLIKKRELQKTEHTRYSSLVDNDIKSIMHDKNIINQLQKEWDRASHDIHTPIYIEKNKDLDQLYQDIIKRMKIFQKRYNASKGLIENVNTSEKVYQAKKEKDYKFQDELKSLEFQIQKIQHELKVHDKACVEIQKRGEKLSRDAASKLSLYQVKVPKFGKENSLIDLLKTRASQFKEKKHSNKQLDIEIQNLNQKLNENSIEMRTLSKQRTDISEQAQASISSQKKMQEKRYQLLKDKDPDKEKEFLTLQIEKCQALVRKHVEQHINHEKTITAQEALKENKQKEIASLENTFNNQERSLLDSILPKGFKSIEELQTAIIPNNESQKMKKNFEKVQHVLNQEETRYKDICNNLEIEKQKDSSTESLEDIQTRLNQHEKEKENFDRQIGSIEQILNEEKKRNMAREKACQQLQKQEFKCKRWNDLNNLIGSADGNIFRTFAQGLTLNRLIEYSNKHLKKLSDRYLLQRLSPQSLTLNIMDTYQANSLRPTGTLSGGESFLVSLAMALGLSDLAGNSIRLESLFLDEGFGALDDETLEMALNAIERLNHRGKMIGVISHIESLKERIPVHIEVSKIAGGTSRLDIVSR